MTLIYTFFIAFCKISLNLEKSQKSLGFVSENVAQLSPSWYGTELNPCFTTPNFIVTINPFTKIMLLPEPNLIQD